MKRNVNIINNYKYDYEKAVKNKDIILKEIDFPYLRYSCSVDNIIQYIKKLIDFKVNVIESRENMYSYILYYVKLDNYKYKDKYVMIIDNPEEYPELEVISDYFNEQCRMKCKFTGAEYSPYDFFTSKYDNIISHLYINNLPITINNMREAVYNIGPKQCSMFKPKILKYFIEKYNAKKILDISSGWGDRLIAALSCDVDVYHGHDPNKCLFDGYNNIIEFFKKHFNRKGEYIIKNIPFEETKLQDNYYDLMMTSPPYFDVEIYSDDSTQSAHNVSEMDWVNLYLLKWIDITKKALKKDGIMAMNINQFGKYQYVDYMFKVLQVDKDWEYLGVVSHAKMKNGKFIKPQPTFIFKKI